MVMPEEIKPTGSKVYFLLFAIGLLIFFTISFTFTFKEKVFKAFFQRPFSFALEEDDTPKVELIAGIDNSFKRGVVNVENGQSNISLKWKVENDPTSCAGKFWSEAKQEDPSWSGPKNIKEGDYLITEPLQTGIYVYSITCSNQSGDSAGSNLIINVGAKPNRLQPHIASISVTDEDGKQLEIDKLNQVDQNSKINISWSSINTETPFGICVASGSWPTVYKNTANLQIKEVFSLDKAKIYKYSIFCSNENGYETKEISLMVR